MQSASVKAPFNKGYKKARKYKTILSSNVTCKMYLELTLETYKCDSTPFIYVKLAGVSHSGLSFDMIPSENTWYFSGYFTLTFYFLWISRMSLFCLFLKISLDINTGQTFRLLIPCKNLWYFTWTFSLKTRAMRSIASHHSPSAARTAAESQGSSNIVVKVSLDK